MSHAAKPSSSWPRKRPPRQFKAGAMARVRRVNFKEGRCKWRGDKWAGLERPCDLARPRSMSALVPLRTRMIGSRPSDVSVPAMASASAYRRTGGGRGEARPVFAGSCDPDGSARDPTSGGDAEGCRVLRGIAGGGFAGEVRGRARPDIGRVCGGMSGLARNTRRWVCW